MSSPVKTLVVIDENDQIVEQIPCQGTNSTQQRALEKETKKRYAWKKVTIRVGYLGVSEEVFERTKKFMQEILAAHPIGEVFVKDRPEFKHLGYNMK